MKPLKLTMQAFGSYGKRTQIDFEAPSQKLFLITGDTGAGKTTIFDAIVFALYGEASSNTNKKDGIVLQSQYTGFDREPFVELTFSEGHGEAAAIYTVRRIPRHLKLITRGAGKGVATREAVSSVTLTMPDGTEYPQKEANRKLEEIVGLTKSQFMQVAMIAQGEFMELLRAKSDDKKLIFRKLFNTELFQRIVDELNERKKAKEKDIAVIRTECQTVAARTVIPEDAARADALVPLKKRITDGEIIVMEEFLAELRQLCEELRVREQKEAQNYKELGKVRDAKRDAYTNALQLLDFFAQLDRAEKETAAYEAAAGEISEKQKLSEQLGASYEVLAEYRRYADAAKAVTDAQSAQKEQQDALPGLALLAADAAEKETREKELYEQMLSDFNQISEKAGRAIELFAKIDEARSRLEEKQKHLTAAKKAAETVQQEQQKLETQETGWREEQEQLGDVAGRLVLWENASREIADLKAEADSLTAKQREVGRQQKKAEKSRDDYAAAKEEYLCKNADYENRRQIFLDAQAGFLARELQPGKPCPVCGSLEHPSPCPWKEEHENISSEVIEALAREAEELRAKQEKLAAEARSDADLLKEKENSLGDVFVKLCGRMNRNAMEGFQARLKERLADSGGNGDDFLHFVFEEDRKSGEKEDIFGTGKQPKEVSGNSVEKEQQEFSVAEIAAAMKKIRKLLMDQEKAVRLQGEQLQKDGQRLQEVKELLERAGERKKQLEERAVQAAELLTNAKAELEGSRAVLQNLEESREYPAKEDAQRALKQAKAQKDRQNRSWKAAGKAAADAKAAKDQTEALIARYMREIPVLEEQKNERKHAYEELMLQKNLSEPQWSALVRQYPAAKAEELRTEVSEYHRKLAVARALKVSALENIANRPRPVIDELRAELDAAEEQLEAAKKVHDRCREDYRNDWKVYEELAPRMETRQKIVQEHAKLDTLYRLLSGNVSGSRMDLETYVQRCYLERILYAANRRFRDMSAGQFELRMVELGKAGEGKNRGLDLMVYSNVTGKEREVRTLSGGESFMAALSLALGMADQIQENSAAVNLDIMFIDEGFGSLDEHSRNQAVKVLLEMAEGSKLIGIISHVTELKQEIEDQLLVSKDEDGSHVRWQLS